MTLTRSLLSSPRRLRGALIAFVAVVAVAASATLVAQQAPSESGGSFRFRSAVELINVTATVTDRTGRFVSGLQRQDFAIFEDGQPQSITHFSNERVPVSLGIVLDVSGSMAGEKFRAAEQALNRFLYDLLSPEDEIFIVTFSDQVDLASDWTTDRRQLARALSMVRPRGGTSLYDAAAEAVPMAQSGRHKKKAVLIISDGVDTDSRTDPQALQSMIRETEVLVYAIGIEGGGGYSSSQGGWSGRPSVQLPFPFPLPGGRRLPGQRPRVTIGNEDRVDVGALRAITDDSGGRTEVTRGSVGIDPATASIADELSQQYSLGYVPPRPKDGRWHAIRVEVDRGYQVRARRGYMAQ
jgi:Ca-activated chloride channel family protein